MIFRSAFALPSLCLRSAFAPKVNATRLCNGSTEGATYINRVGGITLQRHDG